MADQIPPTEKLTDWRACNLGNYYGEVTLARRPNGQWVLTLEDWDCVYAVPVSDDFAEAWRKQFPEKPAHG